MDGDAVFWLAKLFIRFCFGKDGLCVNARIAKQQEAIKKIYAA
jgi:hypothetical protein